MKKLLFIIIAIFSLHCPGYSMYSQAGIFTDGTDWPGEACEEGGSEQQGPSNMSIVPERTETEPSSLSETEAKAVTKSNYTATTLGRIGRIPREAVFGRFGKSFGKGVCALYTE